MESPASVGVLIRNHISLFLAVLSSQIVLGSNPLQPCVKSCQSLRRGSHSTAGWWWFVNWLPIILWCSQKFGTDELMRTFLKAQAWLRLLIYLIWILWWWCWIRRVNEVKPRQSCRQMNMQYLMSLVLLHSEQKYLDISALLGTIIIILQLKGIVGKR